MEDLRIKLVIKLLSLFRLHPSSQGASEGDAYDVMR